VKAMVEPEAGPIRPKNKVNTMLTRIRFSTEYLIGYQAGLWYQKICNWWLVQSSRMCVASPGGVAK